MARSGQPVWPDLQRSPWDEVRSDDDRLKAGIRRICRRHGFGDAPIERFGTGSVPVYAVGEETVLKLFPPGEEAYQRTETAALGLLYGRLRLPTPRVVAADTDEGWPYVLMSRCPGQPLRAAWTAMTPADRSAVVAQIGRGLADLHRLPAPARLGDAREWSSFVAEQRRTVVDRQRGKGLDAAWLDRIEPFFSGRPERWPDDGAEEWGVLHTEVMREHVIVQPAGSGWRSTGLIDFEPSMVGPRRYELASVGLFVTEGDAALFDVFLDAYGLEPLRGQALAERVMAHALLHRYANFPWYLDRLPPPAGVDTLAGLARYWFGGATGDGGLR